MIKKKSNFDEVVARWTAKQVEVRAAFLEERARYYCPVDTGELKADIHTEDMENGNKRVGSSLPKAAYTEFGTSGPHAQRPQAWLRTALIDTLTEFAKK